MTVLNRPLFRQAGGSIDGPAQAMPEDIPMRGAGAALGSMAGAALGSMVGPAQAMPEEDDINRQIRATLENEPSSVAKMGGGNIDEAVRLGRSLYDTEMALRRLKELERAPQRNRREIQEVSREIQVLQQRIKNSGLRQSDIRSLEIALMPMRNKFGDPLRFLPSKTFEIENRAMGGEMMASEQMMAPPPPQTMAPGPAPMPPGADVVQQTEQMAAAQGQKIGQDYAQRMMQGIDQAQSTEELINAFRGNEMPLEARRDELAGYVGEGDADQTPESVLAMVQPVIMMTEEGAMNSGIGNLMQQLTGDIDMMTEAGAPTDMGQGVGSLMMAGAPEAPAPQNFRQGGEVAYLDNGSNDKDTAPPESRLTQAEFLQALEGLESSRYEFNPDNVSSLYTDKLLPLFNQITDQDERAAEEAEARQFDKTLALASLGQAGLRLAAGDPKAGGSFASQLAAAFQPTAGELAALGAGARKRRSDIRAEDRALRTAALQGAMGIEQQAASTRAALEEARIRARVKNYNPVTYVKPIEDDTTTPEVESGLDFRTVDPRDSKDVADAKKEGFVPESVYRAETGRDTDAVIKGIKQRDGTVRYLNVNSEDGQNEIALASAEGRPVLNLGTERPPEPALVTVDGKDYISTDEGVTYIKPGEENPVSTPPDALVRTGEDRNKYIKNRGRQTKYALVRDAFFAAQNNNPDLINFDPAGDLAMAFTPDELKPGSLQVIVNQQGQPTNQTAVAGTVVPATNLMSPAEYQNILDLVVPNVYRAAEKGTGPSAAFDAFIDNTFAGLFSGEGIADTQEARQTLRSLMILTRSALVDNDRYAVREMESIGSLFANPDIFFASPDTQQQQLKQLKRMLVNRYMGLIEEGVAGFQGMSSQKISAKQQKLSQTAAALRLFRNVPIEYTEKERVRARQAEAVRNALGGLKPIQPQDSGGP